MPANAVDGTIETMTQELPENDRIRLEAIGAEARAIAEAMRDGTLEMETLQAGLEAIAQIPLEPETILNSVHIPKDAGQYAPHLTAILSRIPDGWGRWIGCGPGWYKIIADLDQRIAEIAPEYEIHQVKEKYGTLRYYWSMPVKELPCCADFHKKDPRPMQGAIVGPLRPKNRSEAEQKILEDWFNRYSSHLETREHRETNEARWRESEQNGRNNRTGEIIEQFIEEAENLSATTCERCGEVGKLHVRDGWYQTLCEPCGDKNQYHPYSEEPYSEEKN